ncbi:type II toxin-antitoxin system YafQ family toxin [Psychrobacter sanguinis]|uniref:type II toxin-antitoxin system YafQ family toxin n=1 Tax=Psychrobacter sanguinis TaxID=861445 RepID=UPI00020C933D|nr:type II toxin-antitoxin system YafQ family toxin [Psychrobacter sanguinis]EGK15327.1 RelE family addiction module antitoxin [Psychrobacter sp. 1501(2011)]MCD9151416.1 type II toxin-antitoxin system YafQ family toxin [Psychrobacter sanguinis]
MVRTLYPTKQLKRDAKKHYLQLLTPQWAEIINCLAREQPLPEKYKDHALTGNWSNCRDCHVKPDLVLIYEIQGSDILLHRLGSHSELF